MIYTIKTLGGNANGQALLESVEKRGNFPAISLLMPENKARQIVAALNLCETLANVSDAHIEIVCSTNVQETMKTLRANAKKIFN